MRLFFEILLFVILKLPSMMLRPAPMGGLSLYYLAD
jgi:hypothetical protein